MSRHLSTSEAARILDMKEARIRELVRAGLCRPARRGHRYAFGFQDLVVLRTARGLIERKVPATRVRRALAALVRELPPHRPVSAVRVWADGGQVAVYDGSTAWQPETGQTVWDFEVGSLEREMQHVRGAVRAAPGGPARAQLAFEQALELEDDDPKGAADAYARALALDPELVDACVNLGRLRHDDGRAGEAVALYEQALAQSPDDPVIHFNLALALEDTRGAAAAAAHYEKALALDPDFADAHYNVAGLYEQLDRPAEALRHYRAYQKLTDA